MRQIKLIALVVVAVLLLSGLGAQVTAHGANPFSAKAEQNKCDRVPPAKIWARILRPGYDSFHIAEIHNSEDGKTMKELILDKNGGMGAPDDHIGATDYGTDTKAQIRSSLEDLAKQITAEMKAAGQTLSDDLVVIYFSGHGAKEGDHTYLVPFDGKTTVERVHGEPTGKWWIDDPSTCISDAEFVSWVSKIPSKNTVVIVDACNSGGIAKQFQGDKYVVLASSEASELSWSGEPDSTVAPNNGYFTKYFADAFKDSSTDKNGDGSISFKEAFDFAQQKAREAAEKEGHKQNPKDSNPKVADKIKPTCAPPGSTGIPPCQEDPSLETPDIEDLTINGVPWPSPGVTVVNGAQVTIEGHTTTEEGAIALPHVKLALWGPKSDTHITHGPWVQVGSTTTDESGYFKFTARAYVDPCITLFEWVIVSVQDKHYDCGRIAWLDVTIDCHTDR